MGVCQYACSIFCLVAGLILTIFWLITKGSDESDTNLTFLIIAVEKEWDLKEKSNSCRNGAFIYYGLSVVLLVWGIISNKVEASRLEAEKRERRARFTSDTPLLQAEDEHGNAGSVGRINGSMPGSYANVTITKRKEARESEDTEAGLLASGETPTNAAKKEY